MHVARFRDNDMHNNKRLKARRMYQIGSDAL